MARRPAHKVAHQPCPYGVFNWADCDYAAAYQWGMCKAMVGKRDPEPCSNKAIAAEGWCGQHYTSRVEEERRVARIAIGRAQLNSQIDSYMEWRRDHPSVWDSKQAAKPRVRRRPHMLTELA